MGMYRSDFDRISPGPRETAPVYPPHLADASPAFDVYRVIDLAICVPILIFVAPLMLLIAALIKLSDPGPAMFGHTRVGFGGASFKCWKFRTMVVDADARLAELLASDPEARREWDADHKLRNDPRVTRLGAFLRKSSLDELPQIFNVLRGEMSLVGPRPIVSAEIGRYGRWIKDYASVRPGITGLWQVMGRNDVEYRKRVAYDVFFARKQSVARYLVILFATVPAVLGRSGSY